MAELLTPQNLFGDDVRQLSTQYQEIRDHLTRNSVRLATHSSHWIVLTLANGLYLKPEERGIAEILAIYIQSGRSSHSKQPIDVSNSSGGSSSSFMAPERVAPIVAMRLKHAKAKFSENTSECWDKYVDFYNQNGKKLQTF